MERIFKRHFWTIELLFVAGMAAELAGTAALLAVRAPAPSLDLAGGPASRPAGSRLDPGALGLAFGVPAKAPPPPGPEAGLAPASPLHAELRATTIANRPEWSLAILRDLDAKATGIYLAGDLFMGAEVVGIEPDRVRVRRDGREEEIAIGVAPAPVRADPVPAPQSSPVPFTRDGNRIQISQDTRADVLANPMRYAGDARFMPAFENGSMRGFRISGIRPEGIFPGLGIKNGDVIQRVDGLALDSAESALQAFTRVRSERRIEVEIQRSGQPIAFSVEVR